MTGNDKTNAAPNDVPELLFIPEIRAPEGRVVHEQNAVTALNALKAQDSVEFLELLIAAPTMVKWVPAGGRANHS